MRIPVASRHSSRGSQTECKHLSARATFFRVPQNRPRWVKQSALGPPRSGFGPKTSAAHSRVQAVLNQRLNQIQFHHSLHPGSKSTLRKPRVDNPTPPNLPVPAHKWTACRWPLEAGECIDAALRRLREAACAFSKLNKKSNKKINPTF